MPPKVSAHSSNAVRRCSKESERHANLTTTISCGPGLTKGIQSSVHGSGKTIVTNPSGARSGAIHSARARGENSSTGVQKVVSTPGRASGEARRRSTRTQGWFPGVLRGRSANVGVRGLCHVRRFIPPIRTRRWEPLSNRLLPTISLRFHRHCLLRAVRWSRAHQASNEDVGTLRTRDGEVGLTWPLSWRAVWHGTRGAARCRRPA